METHMPRYGRIFSCSSRQPRTCERRHTSTSHSNTGRTRPIADLAAGKPKLGNSFGGGGGVEIHLQNISEEK